MRAAAPIVLLLLAGFAHAMETPQSRRLSPARLAAAQAYSESCGGQAFLVMRSGSILHEAYAAQAARRPIWTMSIAKNLAALAVFAARADRLLSLDERASDTLAEWKKDGRREITIRQLLDQTSGLAPAYESIYARGVRNKNKAAVSARLVRAPGTRFDYAPSNYEAIEEILRRKLEPKGKTPLGYLQSRVLSPIGVSPDDWSRDRESNPFFSAGAKLAPLDLAKIGEFVRTRGRVWIFPAVPSGAFQGAFAGSSANSMYGLSFWLNGNARRDGASPLSIEGTLGEDRSPEAWSRSCISSAAPPDLIAMVGSGGIRVYVVPSRKLVIVRTGSGRGFGDAAFLSKLFGAGEG